MTSNYQNYEGSSPFENTQLGTFDEHEPAGVAPRQVSEGVSEGISEGASEGISEEGSEGVGDNELIDNFMQAYPEFADLPESAISSAFSQSELMLSRAGWGRWFQMAQAFWCAHNLALQWDVAEPCAKLGKRNPYDVSALSSQTASTNSLSLSTTPNELLKGDDPQLLDFARTSYGMRYLNLLYTVIPSGEVVCSPPAAEGPSVRWG